VPNRSRLCSSMSVTGSSPSPAACGVNFVDSWYSLRDGHGQLARTRPDRVPVFDAKIARPVDNTRAHAHLAFYRTESMPPSTYSRWPLTKSDAGEHRKISAPTSSDTVPQRPAGVRSRTHALNFSSAARAAVRSVVK